MKIRARAAIGAVAIALSGLALADSGTYIGATAPMSGVNAGISGSAAVPYVLLLRVGASNSVSNTALDPTISITTGSGNWDGSDPTSTSPTAIVNAYAYTNNAAGAKLTCSQTGLNTNAGVGIYTYDITVDTLSLAPATTNDLAHPGADLGCAAGDATTIANNQVLDARWRYKLDGAAVVGAIPAGTHTWTVTYTLTNL